MKILPFLTAIVFTSVIVSCKNKDEKQETQPVQIEGAPIPQPPTPAAQTNTVPATTTPVTTTPVTTTTAPAPTVQPVTAAPAANTTAATGLNPKHGMPGHRCDIPEGAPLNSKPASNIVPPAQTGQNAVNVTKTQSVSIPQPTPVSAAPATGAGLNPEHGKPGHRCDIAVGAPLNSAPAAKQ